MLHLSFYTVQHLSSGTCAIHIECIFLPQLFPKGDKNPISQLILDLISWQLTLLPHSESLK